MKKSVVTLQSLALLFAGSMLFVACNSSGDSKDANKDTSNHGDHTTVSEAKATSAEAVISGTKSDTTVAGKATFTDENGMVKLQLEINVPQLANKSVAVHLHQHGDCGNSGNNSHGHWNPTGKQHGKWGVGEYHSGDIGNVALDGTGKGTYTMESSIWTLGGDSTMNILGKAVIVHSGVDDYKTQPSGNAGSRIGCGVIEAKK
jgi:Cu-Zn family superoxide dismutase